MNTDYYVALERFVDIMSDIRDIDPDRINDAASELGRIFRISEVKVEIYDTPKHESRGKGTIHTFCKFSDNGREVHSKRIMTEALNVIHFHMYMRDDEQPWSNDEQNRIDLILKMSVAFAGRMRLIKIAEQYVYYDDDGYQNLRFYIKKLNKMAAEGTLGGNAALHFNLRHFAAVNKQVGRNTGTYVMRVFIEQLMELVGSGVVCRVGGDNFAAVVPVDSLDKVIDYLRGTRVIYDKNSGARVSVSASVGVFVIPEDFTYNDASAVMDKIMAASQAARSSGKRGVVFFDDNMIASREKATMIQQLFPQAMEKEEFLVYYQPKVSIEGGSLAGAEALCRWMHDGKLISPAEFIPVLEQGVEICQLDFYMLDHVCKDIRRWLDEGKKIVRVSVNLSRKHMMDIDLLERIIEIVDRNKVPHEYIEIELTETTTDVEFRDLKRVVNGLQDAGICTSVDDFGIGYSSLNLIKEIPWNVLKVDRSFLPDEDSDDYRRRSVMFKYVIAMAQELGLETIAEGVETLSQVEILRENSCDLAQGFFFDRPLPVSEFEERLREHQYKA